MWKNDVRSRTRLILGLPYDPYPYPPPFYYLPLRQNSISSCSSSSDQCLPSPSSSSSSISLPSVPSSPASSKNDVFDKVKNLAPYFTQNIIKSVANAVTDVMEDEEGTGRPPSIDDLPTDLQTVDISDFKRLLTYQPMVMDSRIFH